MEPGTRPHLHILGACALRLSSKGAPDEHLPARTKRFALLVYLAIAGRTSAVQRDKALALLWPELDQRRAAAALRQSLYVLRRELGGETVVTRGNELRLLPEQLRCDAVAFEEAIETGKDEQALSLYRGNLLDGFHLPDVAPEFEHWLDLQRERFQRRAIEAAERLADRSASRGDLEAAIRWTRRALELDPTHEGALQRLLLLLDRAGDRAGAVRAYEAFARRLEDEFEVEPSAESRALLGAICDRSEAAVTPALASTEERKTATRGRWGIPAHRVEVHPRPHNRAWRYVAPALGFGAVALIAVWAITGVTRRDLTPEEILAADAAPGIAVMPFRVSGTGIEDLHEGMVDLLSLNLDGAGGLRAIDSRTVLARWQEALESGTTPDLAAQLEVARRTGARYAVMGQAIGMGSTLRLSADVYEARTGKRVGHGEAAGHRDSLPFLIDRLAIEALRTTLETEGQPLLRVELASATTPSIPALKAYLEGEGFFRQSEFEKAAQAYARAIEADSTFGLAVFRYYHAITWVAEPPALELQRVERLLDSYARDLSPRQSLLLDAKRGFIIGSPDVLPALQRATRQYPEDPEIWFALGELYYHYGFVIHVPRAEIRRTFERAIILDPGFTPAYHYLIDLGFAADDAGQVSRWVTALAERAPESSETHVVQLGRDLVYGDSRTRARLTGALDTLPTEALMRLKFALLAPSQFELVERITEILVDRPGLEWTGMILRAEACYARGKRAELEAVLAQGVGRRADFTPIPLPPDGQGFFLYVARLAGMPVSSAIVDSLLSFGTTNAMTAFFLGARAAEAGRDEEFDRAVATIQREATQHYERGDSAAAGFFLGAAQALTGYDLSMDGEDAQALLELRASVRRATGIGHRSAFMGRLVNYTIQLWTGRLLVSMGRPREAVPYFRALASSPDLVYIAPALLHLGDVHRVLGERDQARDAYRRFVIAWQDADPELQPLVTRARSDAARLGNGSR